MNALDDVTDPKAKAGAAVEVTKFCPKLTLPAVEVV